MDDSGSASVSLVSTSSKTVATVASDGLECLRGGKVRLVAGSANHVNTKTGAETKFPTAFVLYDDDAKVLWMEPQ